MTAATRRRRGYARLKVSLIHAAPTGSQRNGGGLSGPKPSNAADGRHCTGPPLPTLRDPIKIDWKMRHVQ